jgi:hypothetical protein
MGGQIVDRVGVSVSLTPAGPKSSQLPESPPPIPTVWLVLTTKHSMLGVEEHQAHPNDAC